MAMTEKELSAKGLDNLEQKKLTNMMTIRIKIM